MDPQLQATLEQLRTQLAEQGSLDGAATKTRALFRALGVLDDTREAYIVEALGILQREFEVDILRRNSLIRRREEWYSGPRQDGRLWPALKSYLLNAKGWAEENVQSIDEASTEVVSLLANPQNNDFCCRGLVVGHVQSGKTANMTGVIAKAVDAGYDAIIVLAGLTNKLRLQTQSRLEKDIVRRNRNLWEKLTWASEDGDFQLRPNGGFMHYADKAQLAVVKKNVSPLRKILETVEGTIPANLKRLRFLIIDDECDQASVNAASGETDITAINEKIRDLLEKLPCVSYVGYTATPFANVLINPYADRTDQLDDLYPKDFITALPTPEGYFGAEKLFGKPAAMADAEEDADEGLDMIREVPEDDERLIQPPSMKERERFYPRKMPESLEDALLYFLSCCAVRRARGDADQHMTMLVHTSAFVTMHDRLAALIQGWLDKSAGELRHREGKVSRRLEELWKSEQGRLPEDITDAPAVGLDAIFECLPSVLDCLETPVENGASDDRIDYSGEPKTYIVVGGSILARGLTLEGLMVSYFVRSSSQYDTLLQMGRWFGYRHGYEDLPRIWMPVPLQMSFRALAGIEIEIRDDIRQYIDQKVGPMEFAVRIRELPGMAITAANKMRHAQQCDVSWWGQHVQTIRFDHRDQVVISNNWKAAEALVAVSNSLTERHQDKLLFTDVPKSQILRFLRSYSVHESHKDLSNKFLLRFLEAQTDDMLSSWNVGIPQTATGELSEKPIGPVGQVRLFNRSKLRGTGDVADIKALMSKQDVLLDVDAEVPLAGAKWRSLKETRREHVGNKPLLLLYPINANSKAKEGSDVRTDLDAVGDLIGFGIILPGSDEMAGRHVSVDLDQPDPDQLAALEEEERSAMEAAGVR